MIREKSRMGCFVFTSYDPNVYASFAIYCRLNVFSKHVSEVTNVLAGVFRFITKGPVNYFTERVGFRRNPVE